MFRFDNSSLILEIEGHSFEVDVLNAATFEKVSEIQQKLIEAGEYLSGLKEENAIDENTIDEAVTKVIKDSGDGIDAILGEGAFGKIFDNRIVNFVDVIALVAYISHEVNTYRATRMTKYLPDA